MTIAQEQGAARFYLHTYRKNLSGRASFITGSVHDMNGGVQKSI